MPAQPPLGRAAPPSHPETIPEEDDGLDEEGLSAVLFAELASENWGAESADTALMDGQGTSGNSRATGTGDRAPNAALRPAPPLGALADPPAVTPKSASCSADAFGGFPVMHEPAKKKPGIFSSLTAGPAFLQKQLRKATAMGSAGPAGAPWPPGAEGKARGAAVRRPRIKHASTEPTSILFDLLKESGGDGPSHLLNQFSSIDEAKAEEPPDLFLPAASASNQLPFYRQRAFWVSNLLLLAWSAVFVSIGVGLYLSQLCGCVALAGGTCAVGDSGKPCTSGQIDEQSIGWRVMFFLACLPVSLWCSHILGWMLVTAVSGVESWAERCERRFRQRQATARLLRELEQERRQREQVEAEKQWVLQRQNADLSSGRLSGVGSSSRRSGSGPAGNGHAGNASGSSGDGPNRVELPASSAGKAGRPTLGTALSWQASLLQRAAGEAQRSGGAPSAPLPRPLPAAPAGRKPLSMAVSWQASLLERAAAEAQTDRHSKGPAAPPARSESFRPPSPQKPGAASLLGAHAAGGGGSQGGSGLSARRSGAAAPQALHSLEDQGSEVHRGLGGGAARFLVNLEISYLAEHVRLHIQRCACLGLATGFWAIFWAIAYLGVMPAHNQRFWVFFRVLLCLTLMCVVNLITRTVSSLAGIKLKRMNHRTRMLEVSKREALLQLLLSKGLEDEGDPQAANKLLPPDLRLPEAPGAAEAAAEAGLRQGQQEQRSIVLPGGNTISVHALTESLGRIGRVLPGWRPHKQTRSLPSETDGDIEQGPQQEAERLRRSMTDRGPSARTALTRTVSSSAGSLPDTPLASPREAPAPQGPGALPSPPLAATPSSPPAPATGAAGPSPSPPLASSKLLSPQDRPSQLQPSTSPSSPKSTSTALPPASASAAAAAVAAAAFALGERQRVALASRAGDLSKAHMLADRERHFLEDELRLKYWNARAEAVPGPDGKLVAGREDSTVIGTESDATSLGRFIFHRRLMAFLRLRSALITEAAERQQAERREAERERARAAEEAAAAAQARQAGASGRSGPPGAGGGPAAERARPGGYDRSISAVAAMIPGLCEMFGGTEEEEEEEEAPPAVPAAPPAARLAAGERAGTGGTAASPVQAQGQVQAHALASGIPVAKTASGRRLSALPSGPFSMSGTACGGGGALGAGADSRRQQLPSLPGGLSADSRHGGSSKSVSLGRREGLGREDVMAFMEARGAGDETDYAFEVLDRDFDDWITEENVVRMVCQLHKDRHNLRKGLQGTNTILKKLDLFIGGVLHVIFIIFYLLVWGVAFTENFYNAFSAMLLAFSFIFQSTITNLYENVVFIFLIHPFDVGDTLLLPQGGSGDAMARHDVEEIHLNFTRFLDKDNGRCWWPNRVLRDTPFINLSASEVMEDSFSLMLDLDLVARHPDLLAKIKLALDNYCRKHRGEFDTTGTEVKYRDITSPMGVLLKAEWHYSHSGTSKERCANARTGLLRYTARVLTDLGVRFTWPDSQPGGPPVEALGPGTGSGAGAQRGPGSGGRPGGQGGGGGRGGNTPGRGRDGSTGGGGMRETENQMASRGPSSGALTARGRSDSMGLPQVSLRGPGAGGSGSSVAAGDDGAAELAGSGPSMDDIFMRISRTATESSLPAAAAGPAARGASRAGASLPPRGAAAASAGLPPRPIGASSSSLTNLASPASRGSSALVAAGRQGLVQGSSVAPTAAGRGRGRAAVAARAQMVLATAGAEQPDGMELLFRPQEP